MVKQLTDKQQMFVEEYCKDWNATKAALAAGYSANCAKQIGTNNLSKVYLREAIETKKAEIQAKGEYNRDVAEQHYEQVRRLALNQGDLGAANTAIRGKNNLYGLEKEKGAGQDVKIYLDMSEKGA